MLTQLRKTRRKTTNGINEVVGFVSGLLKYCCPTAVSRLVVANLIRPAVNLKSIGTLAHIGQKIRKRMPPPFANGNTFAAISSKGSAVFIEASLIHRAPTQEGGAFAAYRKAMCNGTRFWNATTGFCMALNKVFISLGRNRSRMAKAATNACSFGLSASSNLGDAFCDDKPVAKSSSDERYFLSHNDSGSVVVFSGGRWLQPTLTAILAFLFASSISHAAFFDAYNHEARAWRAQVRTNSSDVMATSYVSSVVLMQHLRQWGLRPKIVSMGIYTGTNFQAVRMAMIHDLPNMNGQITTNGFVATDYTEATGVTGDGTTKFMQLAFGSGTVTMSQLTTAAHLGVYCRSNVSALQQHFIGATDAGSDSSAYCLANLAGTTYGQVNDTVSLQWSVADTNAVGLYIATRTATNFAAVYKNGVQLSSQTGNLSGTHQAPETIFVHALNANGTAVNHTARTLCFWTVGYGLTATDNLNYYKAVQRHQINLGRAL